MSDIPNGAFILLYQLPFVFWVGFFFGLVDEQPGLMDGRMSELEPNNLYGPFQPKPSSDCEFRASINPVWAAFAFSITFKNINTLVLTVLGRSVHKYSNFTGAELFFHFSQDIATARFYLLTQILTGLSSLLYGSIDKQKEFSVPGGLPYTCLKGKKE